jgi:hypothetical protein
LHACGDARLQEGFQEGLLNKRTKACAPFKAEPILHACGDAQLPGKLAKSKNHAYAPFKAEPVFQVTLKRVVILARPVPDRFRSTVLTDLVVPVGKP